MLELAELGGADPASRRRDLHDGRGVGDDSGVWAPMGAKPDVGCLVRMDSGIAARGQASPDNADGSSTTYEKVKRAAITSVTRPSAAHSVCLDEKAPTNRTSVSSLQRDRNGAIEATGAPGL